MPTMIVEESGVQAKKFIEYARTLPFVVVKEEKANSQNVWEAAIAEGAVTVKKFTDELRTRIEKWPDDNA